VKSHVSKVTATSIERPTLATALVTTNVDLQHYDGRALAPDQVSVIRPAAAAAIIVVAAGPPHLPTNPALKRHSTYLSVHVR